MFTTIWKIMAVQEMVENKKSYGSIIDWIYT